MQNFFEWNKFIRLLSIGVIALIAIATFASIPAYAFVEGETLLIAQASSLCRATKVDTPVFQYGSTTSNAIRIVPKDTRVNLAYIPTLGSQFAEIQSPISGFIQTAVLKTCATPPSGGGSNPWDKPTIGTDCRQVVRPDAGVNIRRQPTTNSDILTKVYPGDTLTVTLTTGNVVKSYRTQDYDWIEIDLGKTFPGQFTGTGWMYNTDLINTPGVSNLAYCS